LTTQQKTVNSFISLERETGTDLGKSSRRVIKLQPT